MKKLKLFNNKGSILIEVLISALLITSCIYGLSFCLVNFSKNYTLLLYKRELRNQMNLALFCMTYDLKRAKSIRIDNFENKQAIFLVINDDQDFPFEYIGYTQKSLDFNNRILKNGKPITGDNNYCPTSITFNCIPLDKDNKIYLLNLTGKCKFLKTPIVIETALYHHNFFIENNEDNNE